jgi:hypothetical protein
MGKIQATYIPTIFVKPINSVDNAADRRRSYRLIAKSTMTLLLHEKQKLFSQKPEQREGERSDYEKTVGCL